MEIWMNPACMKCRVAKKALDDAGVTYTERRYLEDVPTAAELGEVLGRMDLDPWDIARPKESREAGIDLPKDVAHRDDWIAAMVAHPRTIQRPIITADDGTTVVARDDATLGRIIERWRSRMHHGGSAERPAVFFDDAAEFRAWLEEHHESAAELWMGLYKKHVTPQGLTWAEAVAEALCFGWIDSVAQRIDDDARRQRWTPRRPTSVWSQVNIDLVAKLTAEGRMRPAGLAAFAKRRPERSGIYAYENAERELSVGYQRMLAANPRAAHFWAGATPSYRKLATNWVMSAKQEATRDRRMDELVDDCAAGRLIKPQRYGTEPAWVRRVRGELDHGAPQ